MKFPAAPATILLLALIVNPLLADELPQDSIYQLDVPLETHRGDKMPLASLQGRPVIITMFYGSCPHVCPMLISTVQQLEKQLPENLRDGLRVAMVSVDPRRDTPEHLREIALRRGVESERWILARTSAEGTRPLAAVLGIQYKTLPDGEFNHTSVLVLLDADGRELARSSRLGAPDKAFVQRVEAALRSSVS